MFTARPLTAYKTEESILQITDCLSNNPTEFHKILGKRKDRDLLGKSNIQIEKEEDIRPSSVIMVEGIQAKIPMPDRCLPALE